jgi:potassium-transporting ATPase KdpC subunit
MGRELWTSIRAVLVFTVICGLIYPFAVWGIGQVAFHGRANGSQIHVNGKLVGSRLIGEDFSKHPEYFQERPSQDSYDSAATFFSNRGPNSSAAVYFYRDQLAAYLKREQPYDRGLTAAQVPVDAVTTSGSGVDPQISVANARIQAHRIAAQRKLALATVNQLIDDNTDGRFLGVLGEPGVNVVDLNLALDHKAPVQ